MKIKLFLLVTLALSILLTIPLALSVIDSITLNSPASLANTSNTTPDFNFTAVSTTNTTFSCVLYVDGANVGSNASTSNHTATIITSSALSEGVKSWKIGCTDAGGEVNSSAQTLNIDATAPIVTASSPANGANISDSTPDFSFKYTDAAPTASCELFVANTGYGTNASTLNDTVTVITANASVADGSHSWYVNCTDSAGNRGASTSRTINIDTATPVVTLNNPASGVNTSDDTPDFNFTATNAASTLSCTLFIGNTAMGTDTLVSNATATIITANASLSDGSHNWYVNCTDDATNTGTSETRTITVDTAVPTVTINSPDNDTLTSDSTPDINFTAINAAPTLSCELFIDNLGYGINFPTENGTATVLGANGTLSDGAHNFYVNCTDFASNTGKSETRTITVDTTAPVIATASPTPGNNSYKNSNSATINVTITEAVGVDVCTLKFDGVNQTMTKSGVTCYATKANLTEGIHNFTVFANDTVGNTGSKGTYFFTVDTANPQIQFVSPTETSGSAYRRTNIQVNVTAIETNLANITIRLYNSTTLVNSTTVTTSPEFLNFTNLGDGIYYFNATAVDDAGNSNSTTTRNVTIDTVKPTISSIAVTAPATYAVVRWQTSESANSTVSYGLTLSLGGLKSNSSLSTLHSLTLTALSSDTIYFYNLTSCDLSGNCNTTGPNNFTTASEHGGGGSSSGGSSGPSTSHDIDLNTNPESIVLKLQGYAVKFTADGVNTHTLSIDEVTDDSVTITIASDPVTMTLKIGDTRTFVLDNYQLSVTLSDIINKQAKLDIKRLGLVTAPQQVTQPEQSAPVAQPTETPQQPAETTGAATAQPAPNKIALVIVVLVLIAIAASLTRGKKTRARQQ